MSDKEKAEASNQTGQPAKSPVDPNQVAEQVSTIVKKQQKPKEPQDDKPSGRRKPPRSDGESYARCLMFFPTSGHMGFDIIKTSNELPPIDIVRQMVAYDIQLRLCEPIQNLIDQYHHDEAIITFIHDLLQQHVVEHFGYHDVNALRTALYRFPDDSTIKDAFYVKYNRVTQGLVNQGQCARDVDLFTLDGQPTNLFSHISAGQPLVILAGSTS